VTTGVAAEEMQHAAQIVALTELPPFEAEPTLAMYVGAGHDNILREACWPAVP